MSLEALAPDQRAVVQLVLQQERSYDDLAGLLGISTEAVRERARAGLETVGGAPGDLTAEERGEIADYLLGQQSVSRREATRSLLSSSADARRWAHRVSDALEDVARSPLPGVPDGHDVSPTTIAPAAEPTTASALTVPDDEDEDEDPAEAPATFGTTEPETAPVRARPRPRPREDAPRPRPKPDGDAADGTDRPRASRIGGALLIAGIAVMLAVAVIFIFRDNEEEEPASNSAATPTATATATAEATPAAAGQIELTPPDGGDAKGAMTILVSQDGKVQFSIEGTGVPPSAEGEAYAVWLTGGPRPKRLGFAPTVGEDGKLGVSGPRDGDGDTFPRDFSRARRVVISRETSQDSTKPGPIILQGQIPRGTG